MLKFMLSDLFIFLFFYFFFGFHLSDQIHNTLNELSDMINLFPMWSSLIHNQMKVFFRLWFLKIFNFKKKNKQKHGKK